MLKDKFDIEILDHLQENARISFVELGKKVGLSPTAVAERVRRLEDDEVISKYKTVLNVKKVGLSMSAFISIKFHSNQLKQFQRDIEKFPEIVECHRVTGNECLIMKLHLKDSLHLEKVIDALLPYGDPTTSVILSEWNVGSKVFMS